MTLELTHVVGVLALIATAISLFGVMKKDNRTDGITQGKLSNDLEYVKRGVDGIQLDQKDQAREQARMREALINTQNDAHKAMEHAERAYSHATEAHSRINKLGGTK